jgi:electron transport complex protein RnfC
LKSFKIGGIHPYECKLGGVHYIDAPLPEKVYIPLLQHIGAPGKAVIKKGDRVKAGSLIASAAGAVSANIHSSISGVVEDVALMIDASGFKRETIVIKREGDDFESGIDTTPDVAMVTSLGREEMLKRIQNCGIVGMGGAAFPTHIKYKVSMPLNTLLINGAECEPYLTCDDALMNCHAQEIFVGIDAVLKILDIDRAYIGVERNKSEAINALKKYETECVKVIPLKVKYPQGSEKQLITAILGREVPLGKLTYNVGVVVSNVATIYACYQAIFKGRPLISRLVTFAGALEASNVNCRIGSRISEVVDSLSLKKSEAYNAVISGGPMMGRSVVSEDVPVTKGLGGVLFFQEEEDLEEVNCIRCARCVRACPMGLMPMNLKDLVKNKLWDDFKNMSGRSCFECGACSYICPSSIPILDYIRLGKAKG